MLTPAEAHMLKMALLSMKNTYNNSPKTRVDWVKYVASTTKLRRTLQ